ncbi:MAG: hypothetical protein AB7I30_12840 [Isosphaeraceae bacterium]
MLSRRQLALRVTPTVAVALALFASGCGSDSGLPQRYPVSGKVTYKGEPVPKGRIDFVTSDPEGRSASGEITDGYYKLTTADPGDGALPGKYKVTVTSVEVDTSEMEKIAQGGQFHHDKAFFKAQKTAKNLLPPRYKLADTSGLEAEVKEESNTHDFELVD